MLPWASVTRYEFAYAHLPVHVVIQENGSLNKIQNFWGKKYTHGAQMRSSICLFIILSPERWVNSWRKRHWICTEFSCFDSVSHKSSKQGYQRIFGLYLCFWERNAVQQAENKELSCPTMETARCQMLPQTYLWYFKDMIKTVSWFEVMGRGSAYQQQINKKISNLEDRLVQISRLKRGKKTEKFERKKGWKIQQRVQETYEIHWQSLMCG